MHPAESAGGPVTEVAAAVPSEWLPCAPSVVETAIAAPITVVKRAIGVIIIGVVA
jgi:hypothetical protein